MPLRGASESNVALVPSVRTFKRAMLSSQTVYVYLSQLVIASCTMERGMRMSCFDVFGVLPRVYVSMATHVRV